jgi:PIN domain nuclease of toxin-antitoxin system
LKLLLDTHAFLWLKTDPARFSAATIALLEDQANSLHLSSASAWEIAIKHALGKLPLPVPPARYVSRGMSQSGISELPTTIAHALRAGALPPHHGDPFDRLLVAQAQLEKAALVSADQRLRAYDVRVIAP